MMRWTYLLLVLIANLFAFLDGRSVLQLDRDIVLVSKEEELQAALLVIEPGQTVELDVEELQLIRRLQVNVSGVELRGRGSPTVLLCPPNDHALVIEAPAIVRNLKFRNCSSNSAVLVQSTDVANSANVSAIFSQVGFHHNGASNGITNGAGLSIIGCGDTPCTGPLVQALVEECDFTENRVNGAGAAIFCKSCNLTISSSLFQNNTAGLGGGAVYLNDGFPTLRITSSSFVNNRVQRAGVNQQFNQANNLPLESLRYFTFRFPEGSGGAIETDGAALVIIEDSAFRRNRAPAGGAMSTIFREQSSNSRESRSFKVQISDCTFENNEARTGRRDEDGDPEDNLGGAIYLLSSVTDLRWTLRNSALVNNSARHGGGVHLATLRSVDPEIQNCTFQRNVASGAGGGLLARNTGSIRLEGSMFLNNKAGFGGGIMLTNGAKLSGKGLTGIDPNNRQGVRNQFIGNSAVDGGGLMCSACGDLLLADTIFSDNSAERLGGGVYCVDTPVQVTLQQVSLEGNTASRGGGAAFSAVAIITISAANFDGFYSSISHNVAASGGGVYIKSNRQQENKIQIQTTVFSNNTANQTTRSQAVSIDCGNGGGGGICLVLDGIPEASTAQIQILNVSFTDNEAAVGGGMFVEVAGEVWNTDLDRQTCPEPAPSTDSCRLLAFTILRFFGNRAESGGGAMFVSNPELVVAGCSRSSLAAHVPLDTVFATEQDTCLEFQNNTVINGTGEYGPQIATRVYSLHVVSPLKPIRGLTGGTRIVPPCEDCGEEDREGVVIAIRDAFNQTITGGIADSRFHVSLISEYIFGENIYQAQDGFFNINRTNGVGVNETRAVEVQLNEHRSISTSFSFSTRRCHPGEIEVGQTCERCEPGTYSFDPNVACRDCPDHAQCPGNSSLVPVDGYWHSTPFSPQFHECIFREACEYSNRIQNLTQYYSNRQSMAEELSQLDAFVAGTSTQPEYEDYYQCAEGYRGVLCGSCEEGYGHLPGGECVECSAGRRGSSLIAVLIFLWSAVFVGLNIFTTLNSTQRHILMVLCQNRDGSPSALETRSLSRGGELRTTNESMHEDRVIAMIKVTELLKIFINYLQVTSVALSINLNWQELIRALLSIQGLVMGVASGSYLGPLDCTFDDSSTNENSSAVPNSIKVLWLQVTFPLILLVFFCLLCGTYLWIYRSRNRMEDSISFKSYFTLIASVVVFFSYVNVTSELMRTVNCIGVDDEDEQHEYQDYAILTKRRVWAEDTQLDCFEGDHTLTGVFGVLGLIFFSLMVILFILFWLPLNSHRLKEPKFIAQYGFIYQGYKEKWYLTSWEAIIAIRKALIAAAVVFAFPLGPNLQGVCALGVIILAIAVHFVFSPFKSFDGHPNVPPYAARLLRWIGFQGIADQWVSLNNSISLNAMESASLLMSMIVFYSGILFNDENTSEGGKHTMSVFTFLVNVTFVVYVLYRLYGGAHVAVNLSCEQLEDIPPYPTIPHGNGVLAFLKKCYLSLIHSKDLDDNMRLKARKPSSSQECI